AIVLALCVNVGMFFKTIRHGILTCGAWVAHVGICLVLVGVLVTSIYSKTSPLLIPKGQSAKAFDYNFTYLGLTKGSGVEGDRDHLKFEVTRGSDRMIVRLPYYMAAMPDGQKQLIRNPAIRKYWDHDLYMSANQQSDGTDGVELHRGEAGQVAGYGIKFARFEVPNRSGHGSPGDPIEARTVIEVTKGGKTTILKPAYIVSPNDTQRIPVTMPDGDYMLSIFRIKPP